MSMQPDYISRGGSVGAPLVGAQYRLGCTEPLGRLTPTKRSYKMIYKSILNDLLVRPMNKLEGREAVESALTSIGQLLEFRSSPCSIVVLGGAALNLLGVVNRATIDVDILAREEDGVLRAPAPLPPALVEAIGLAVLYVGPLEIWTDAVV